MVLLGLGLETSGLGLGLEALGLGFGLEALGLGLSLGLETPGLVNIPVFLERITSRVSNRRQTSRYVHMCWNPTAIINGDGGCILWQPVQADSQSKSSGLILGRWPLGTVLHSSSESDKLSQWLCHDDSTINAVLDIIIYYYY